LKLNGVAAGAAAGTGFPALNILLVFPKDGIPEDGAAMPCPKLNPPPGAELETGIETGTGTGLGSWPGCGAPKVNADFLGLGSVASPWDLLVPLNPWSGTSPPACPGPAAATGAAPNRDEC